MNVNFKNNGTIREIFNPGQNKNQNTKNDINSSNNNLNAKYMKAEQQIKEKDTNYNQENDNEDKKSKNNKKNVKVSFIDKVTTQPLVNVIPIECFRNYNYIDGMPKEEKTDNKANCQCCITF